MSPLNTTAFNWFNRAFNEYAESVITSHPIEDTFEVCGLEGDNEFYDCLTCDNARSEVEWWLYDRGALNGIAGTLPRRVYNNFGCCECPCFCEPPPINEKTGRPKTPQVSLSDDPISNWWINNVSDTWYNGTDGAGVNQVGVVPSNCGHYNAGDTICLLYTSGRCRRAI